MRKHKCRQKDVLCMQTFIVIICQLYQLSYGEFYSTTCDLLSSLRAIKGCSSAERQLLLWCYSS